MTNYLINLNFHLNIYILFFLYTYLEIFYVLIYTTIFKQIKTYNLIFFKKINYQMFKNTTIYYVINLKIIYLITLKLNYVNANILSLIFVYLIITQFFKIYRDTVFSFINFNIIVFCFFIMFVQNLITFFLLIELYAIIFYFFFLHYNIEKSTFSTLKLKNALLLYLLNNFLTTILFLICIYWIVEIYGTVNFTELTYLYKPDKTWKLYLLFITFTLKLALPGLHYLKLEIYKYLDLESVIFFSVLTTYINFMLIIYFFNYNFIVVTLSFYKYFNMLIVLSIFFLIQKLKINNFQEFISYSGFATNNLILFNLLTIDTFYKR